MARIPAALREQVRQRASERCEYCQLPEAEVTYPFHIEHIISLKHGGTSDLNNLAWACILCNAAKGTDVAAYDEETGALAPLFNPRMQTWSDHFELTDGEIVGKTTVGRVTVNLLKMNTPGQVAIRKVLVKAGRW